MREIIFAGAGMGDFRHLTPEVRDAIDSADVVFADNRLFGLIPDGKRIIDIMAWWNIVHEEGRVVMLVSGDPGIFSLLPIIKKHYPREKITVLPGISSLQAVCAHAGETWHDAAILSGHGRPLKPGVFLNTAERNRITVLFCDSNISPSWACEKLGNMKGVDVVICSCLGAENESVLKGKPKDFAGQKFPSPSIILVRNKSPYNPERLHLRDRDFLSKPNIVMTNESVRSVIMSRLELSHNSVFWDIGAGSGSISVSAGNEFPFADIHAVECNPEAADLISRNTAKFHIHNINIHKSRALDVIGDLPKPSRVFIGGSDGELSGILSRISAMNDAVRVVIACVTLETFTEAYGIMREWENFEAVQISAVASKTLAPTLTMMKANNPVMILSAEVNKSLVL